VGRHAFVLWGRIEWSNRTRQAIISERVGVSGFASIVGMMKSLGLLAHHARFTDTQFYNLRSCELEPACSRHCDNTRIMTSTTRKITSHWRCLRFWVEFEWRIVWRNLPLRSLLVLVLSWMLPGLNPKRTWFSSKETDLSWDQQREWNVRCFPQSYKAG
jgi:hypothetical protein